ncbi:MAG TPA: hypothetical protein VJ964_08185 [Balneolaceae bacterium]|nr:hypothetical protein [Balneolaceae bacterium]
MTWLKEVIVDIAATILIIIGVFINQSILTGIILAYTGLLLITKLIVYFGDNFLNMMNKAKSNAPHWFTHMLYAINTAILLIFRWWYAGAGWAVIWGISYLTQRKLDQRQGK